MGDDGFEAVAVTEWDEPQAVIGCTLHQLAYPDCFRQHEKRHRELEEAHHHHGRARCGACSCAASTSTRRRGRRGSRVFDVANVDNKDFSERIVTAPVSPLGQRTHVKTRDAAAVALPTNMPMAPWRQTSAQYPENHEQPFAPIYRYAFIADREEGLVLVDVDTLSDGDPENNFLVRETIGGQPSFNPGGALTGAEALAIAGDTIYVACDRGLVAVDVSDPQQPRVLATVSELERPTSVQVQFRYAFVTDRQGLAVVDVTDPAKPRLVARAGPHRRRALRVRRADVRLRGGRQAGRRHRRRRATRPAGDRPGLRRRRRALRRPRREGRSDLRQPPSPTSPTARTACACSSSRRPTRPRLPRLQPAPVAAARSPRATPTARR